MSGQSGEVNMLKKIILIVFIFSYLINFNCGFRSVLVQSSEYDKLKKENRIFVTDKTGKMYEIIDFEITETHIKGTSVLERDSRSMEVVNAEKVEIRLEDVESVITKKYKVSLGFKFIATCILGGIGLVLFYNWLSDRINIEGW